MDWMSSRLVAIIVANLTAGLTVRLTERRLPELRGALWGLYVNVMVLVFSFFFRDMPVYLVSPLHALGAVALLVQVRRRYVRRVTA